MQNKRRNRENRRRDSATVSTELSRFELRNCNLCKARPRSRGIPTLLILSKTNWNLAEELLIAQSDEGNEEAEKRTAEMRRKSKDIGNT